MTTFRIAVMALGLIGALPGIALAVSTDLAVPIPGPGTLALLASGIAALGGINRLRRRKK